MGFYPPIIIRMGVINEATGFLLEVLFFILTGVFIAKREMKFSFLLSIICLLAGFYFSFKTGKMIEEEAVEEYKKKMS